MRSNEDPLLPLSSPLNSGLRTDAIVLVIVLATAWAFAVGALDLLRRVARGRRAPHGWLASLDPVAVAAYAAVAIVALPMSLMLTGLRSVPLAQAVCLLVTAWGAVRGASQGPDLWRWLNTAPPRLLLRRGVVATAMAGTVLFWIGIFRTHVALPAHDGIVHTAFYLRILESGLPTLGRVPIGFADLFGVQRFPFYPTGTHSLLATVGGAWGQGHVISHAGLLKAWFTLTVAGIPWALFYAIRKLAPDVPWWIGVAVALAAVPGFRFPLEAAHEGGAARLIAHLVFIPIYVEALRGRFDDPARAGFAGLTLGVAFLMHPSVFITLAALIGGSGLFALLEAPSWAARARQAAGLLASVLLGGAIIAALLWWNDSAAEPRDAGQPFAWAALLTRWHDGWSTLFTRGYGTAPVLPWVAGLGLVTLLVRPGAGGATRRVALWPIGMVALALAVLATQMLNVPGARLLGGAFYDEIPRVVEVLFEPLGLCVALALWAAWRAVVRVAPRSSLATAVVAVLCVAGGAGVLIVRAGWVRQHVQYWDRQFLTPQTTALARLGTWVIRETPPDAVIFHYPFDSEIWEAWTGRRGSFMYGECHANSTLEPCMARKSLVNDRLDELVRRVARPTPDARCLAELDRFGRPGYLLLPTTLAATAPRPLCSDATLVGAVDRHLIVAYRPPAN